MDAWWYSMVDIRTVYFFHAAKPTGYTGFSYAPLRTVCEGSALGKYRAYSPLPPPPKSPQPISYSHELTLSLGEKLCVGSFSRVSGAKCLQRWCETSIFPLLSCHGKLNPRLLTSSTKHARIMAEPLGSNSIPMLTI